MLPFSQPVPCWVMGKCITSLELLVMLKIAQCTTPFPIFVDLYRSSHFCLGTMDIFLLGGTPKLKGSRVLPRPTWLVCITQQSWTVKAPACPTEPQV
jgi:hypothetical protein